MEQRELWLSPEEVKTENAHKLYQLMNLSMYRIIQEINQRKKDEEEIKYKLMRFSQDDKYLEWKTHELMCHERFLKVEPHLPMRPIPRTPGFFHLTEEDSQSSVEVGTDRKRCHKRLKKEWIDMEYLKQVQEELLSSLKSDRRPIHGAQELNNVMESLVQRIQHGNNNRREETKFFHEIRDLKETIEKYTAPTKPDPVRRCDRGGSRRRLKENQMMQRRVEVLVDQIDGMVLNQKERTTKVTRLKAELELVRKKIGSMEKELGRLNSKRIKAYKFAYKHGE
ncbi:hypothetical protein LXL04_020091 [Taraxacum kok-saghyz]